MLVPDKVSSKLCLESKVKVIIKAIASAMKAAIRNFAIKKILHKYYIAHILPKPGTPMASRF